MSYYIQSYCIILIEIICRILFFETFCRRRYFIRYQRHGILLGAMMIDCVICTVFAEYFWLKELIVIFFWGFVGILLYKESIWKNIFISTMFQGLLLIVDYVTALVDIRLLSDMDTNVMTPQFLLIFLAKAILFMIVLIIKNIFFNRDFSVVRQQDWLKLMVMPVVSVCAIAGLIYDIQVHENEQSFRLYWMIALGLLAMNILVYFFLSDILSHGEKMYENQLFMKQAEDKLNMYTALAEQNKKQQALWHEYKNQISCLKALSRDKNYQRLDGFINEIHEGIRHNMDYINTNHMIVNAVINDKYNEAAEKKIPFVMKFNDLKDLWISDNDIVILLANLLNNAIEASESVEHPFIKVKFILNEKELILAVVNRYSGILSFYEDEIVSGKKKEGHGYGIKNVIKIVKRYGGDYQICTEGGEFSFIILIEKGTS